MGGASGVMPHHLKRLTAEQVEAWWLRPMEAMRKAQQKGQKPMQPDASKPGPMTLGEFKAMLVAKHPDRTPEWWEQRHREWNDAVAGVSRG